MFFTIIGFLSIGCLTVAGGFLRGCDCLGVDGSEDTATGLTLLVCGLLLVGSCLVTASDCVLSSERDRAVEAGVAHYVADSKTGEVTFEYIKQGGK